MQFNVSKKQAGLMAIKTGHSGLAGQLAAAALSAAAAMLPASGSALAQTAAPYVPPGYCSSDIAPYRDSIYLAYIRSSPSVDAISEQGLKVLAERLAEKTSLEAGVKDKSIKVVGIDIETQDICHFQFIYWPVGENALPLSPEAQVKLETYLEHGGFPLFDIRDAGLDWQEALKTLLGRVNLGTFKPVNEVPSVCETFYKNVRNFPGSLNLSPVYAQLPLKKRGDLVSQVIVGERRWADAWAGYTVAPGSAGQEMALRGGINIVLYAFTGGYKCDQAIQTLQKLER
jgi:hypothetical protein